MTKTLLATAVLAVVATAASANPFLNPTPVPEIDALAGTAALAALGASVALIWDRRRR